MSLSALSLRRRHRAALAALARASAPSLACVGVRPSGALEASMGCALEEVGQSTFCGKAASAARGAIAADDAGAESVGKVG